MLPPALLIALNFHEYPTHILFVRELDEDLPALQILIRVLMGELWRLVHGMLLVIGETLLRIV